MKQFVINIISILLLFSACTDKYCEEMPSAGEFTTILLDGVIADRNNDFTKSANPAETEQHGGIAVAMARAYDPEAISTKKFPTTYFMRYMFFDASQNNVHTSSVQEFTPPSNTFSLKIEIPKNSNGEVFVFMTYIESELPTAEKIKTKTDLQNYWSAYTLLSKDDIIPITGSANITQSSQMVEMTLKHIGCKLNLKYTIGSSSDFRVDSICIGNINGRNYFLKPALQTSNTTGSKRYALKTTMQQDDLTFFIPENTQGEKAISNPSDKNKKNAPAKATYIELIGENLSTNKKTLIRIYPGANNTTDFNLIRNGYYRVNLGIYYLEPNDDRITIGTENPTLIFDVINMPQTITSFTYTGSPTPVIQNKRVIITESSNRIGQKISEIKINGKKGKSFYTSILIQPGTNYYTLDWNYKGSGAGTEDDPYLVANLNDLNKVKDYLSSHFLQVEDIKLDNSWGNFNSIGSGSSPFKGVYDGGNKIIDSYMKNQGSEYGLFYYIEDAVIRNVQLTTVNLQNTINSGINVGGVVARGNKSQIINCSVKGSIYITPLNNNVGGIIGEGIDCYIENSFFEGTFSSNSTNKGYIIGKNTNCIIK